MKKADIADLAYILKGRAKEVSAYYRFNLGGGPGDSDDVERIHADAEVIDVIIRGRSLEPASSVPPEFFKLAPTDWLRALPPNAKLFSTPGFDPVKPKEPVQYFLVHDKDQNTAYVWARSTM